MPWHRLLAALCIGLGIAAPAWALDLAQAWELAVQRDPAYAASQYARDAEQEAVPQARAHLLPWITASAGGQVDNTRRRRNLSDSRTTQRGVWALTLSQPLIDMGAWEALERAQYIARSADVAYVQAQQDLILRVTQAYFDVLKAQDTLRALQAQKLAVESQLQAARHGFELGATTITDTHEAQSRLDLLRAAEFDTENAVQVSIDRLTAILAQRPDSLAELDPQAVLPAPQPDRIQDWSARASASNLDVARARLEEKIVQKQLEIAKSDRYPRLSLEAQTGSASDRGIYGPRPDPGPRSLDSSVGLVLSVPLFTGGELSSVIREESSRLQQVRAQVEAARRAAQVDAQTYFSGVTTGLARIGALRAAETSSRAALEANQLAYEVGVRINIDVLNAQQQLYETQRQLSAVRYDTLMDSLRLKASSGTLNADDLMAVNALLTRDTRVDD